MQRIRQLHLWLGVLFSPAIIFFAFTGVLQTFNWHESLKNGSYRAPAWIVEISQLHKHQHIGRGPGSMPLKWFVALMAAGLIITSVLGIYMAFKFGRNPWMVWGLIVAGILLPIVLLLV